MMSSKRTIDENDTQVGVAFIIRKLRKLKKESIDAADRKDQKKMEECYKSVSSVLKHMVDAKLLSMEEMTEFSNEYMRGNKMPGVRPCEFTFVLNDVMEKAA